MRCVSVRILGAAREIVIEYSFFCIFSTSPAVSLSLSLSFSTPDMILLLFSRLFLYILRLLDFYELSYSATPSLRIFIASFLSDDPLHIPFSIFLRLSSVPIPPRIQQKKKKKNKPLKRRFLSSFYSRVVRLFVPSTVVLFLSRW